MAKICVCVEPVLTELSLPERARRAHELGFGAIEFWFHDQHGDQAIAELASLVERTGLVVNDIVVNAPDGRIGGALVAPADREQYLARLADTIQVAKRLNCTKMITCSGNARAGICVQDQKKSIVETLKRAGEVVERAGMTLVLEPLNTTVDHAGYFLDSSHAAAEVLREVGHPNVKMLFDFYHMQIMHGNLLDTVDTYLDMIGHFHAAGVPGRHELDIGELNYPYILRHLDARGYAGYVGLEYWPSRDHEDSLRAMAKLTGASH